MLSAMTLNDHAGNAVALMDDALGRAVTHASGLVSTGPPRSSRVVRPNAHGGINRTRYTDGTVIDLSLEAISPVSVEAAFGTYRTMIKPMIETLDYDAPALLKWTEDVSGLALQKLVKLESDLDPPLDNDAAMLQWQAQFFAEDPRAYSQTLTKESSDALAPAGGGMVFSFGFPFTFSTSSGGTVSVMNSGKRKTPAVFRINGYCLNPQIVNLDTGERIILGKDSAAAEVPAGSYFELDVAARTVKLNGTTSVRNLLDSANTTWWELPPNLTNLQLQAADSSGATLDVLYRDAF